MLRFKITDEVRVKATKKAPKVFYILDGDVLYRRNRQRDKWKEVETGQRHAFDQTIHLKSEGTTYIRIVKGAK